jgi:carboxypeptidase Taq
MPSTSQIYRQLAEHCAKIADIRHASAVLQWDQETHMPEGSNEVRARQLSTLAELAHRLFTSAKTEKLIKKLIHKDDLSDRQQKNVQRLLEDFEKNKKLPASFIQKQTRAVHQGFDAWIKARKANRFKVFEKPLQKIIDLKKQEAELLGYEHHPYDALLNEYDKGITVQQLDKIFSSLAEKLEPIMLGQQKKSQVQQDIYSGKHFPQDHQWNFGIQMLREMHFNFDKGRQDISAHPFTTSFGSSDVRVTTRIDEKNPANMIWSCMHELGHALYEQGLPAEEYGMPLGEACSLSIHESQSRLWENAVGKNASFWKHYFPVLQSYFPEQLQDVSEEQFMRHANRVEPSLIRTEADEVTYHYHIIIRYEIEKLLIANNLQAKDVPAIWREMYKKYLKVEVPDDNSGCLQDVHWSHGSFGYFPTYSIGSILAAQFWNRIKGEQADIESALENGNSTAVFQWLQKNIYWQGRFYQTQELCKQVTGMKLNPQFFVDYISEKLSQY